MKIDYSVEDVADCLLAAENPNAAVKNFLKKEVQATGSGARFAKDLRNILVGSAKPSRERIIAFIEKSLPEYENHLLCIARYAHSEFVDLFADQIIDQYAEEFNSSYEMGDETITILDRPVFDRILKDVRTKIDKEVENFVIKGSNFFKNVIFVSIFEQEVLREVQPH